MSRRSRTPVVSVTIKDCDVQTFTAGGKGGQRQNRVETGVRVIHRASGARGEARDSRHQLQNKRMAFRRMAESPPFQMWLRRKAVEGERRVPVDDVVDAMLARPQDLRVEVKDERGRWVGGRCLSD